MPVYKVSLEGILCRLDGVLIYDVLDKKQQRNLFYKS